MVTNMNGRYANVGEIVVFSEGRFNYQQDGMGKVLPKEPGTAGLAFVAAWQKDVDKCEAFFDSRGIERTTLSRSNLMAGSFALDAVFKEIKSGGWKSSDIRRVTLVTRSPYLLEPLDKGLLFQWELHDWMVKRNGMLSERLNKDLWIDIAATLYDFEDSGIKVVPMFLEKDNYRVLNALVENPITLALQASNGTNLMKDEWYEKTFGDLTQKS